MLSDNLVTNEIKNAAGAEVEFQHYEHLTGRGRIFAKKGESPSYPHRLTIKHSETGTGVKLRRRSAIRFDETSLSQVDSVTPITDSVYVVVDSAVGHHTTSAKLTDLIANLMSFLASTGATTTILYDGTGNGAVVLRDGSL